MFHAGFDAWGARSWRRPRPPIRPPPGCRGHLGPLIRCGRPPSPKPERSPPAIAGDTRYLSRYAQGLYTHSLGFPVPLTASLG